MNNMNKSDLDLAQLLKTFDPDTKSFKFGTKSFQITGNAVTQILGLPNEGKSVKLVNDRYTSTFRTRHFGEKGKPSKNQVEAELQKTIALANQPKKEKAKTEQKKKMNKGKEKKEAEEEEEEEEVDYDKEVVNIVEGWLEYIRPQARVLDCGMFVMFYMDKIAQGQPIPKSVDKKFMNEYRAQYVTKLLHHKNCFLQQNLLKI
ncbi:hypothetical protein Prudu_019456 [Prunus dulcis]|uniref:Uncharacterized protein n=1 Tax=Prunus dulcis TaxID=3755 RepID=A0A4Y1RUS8_PRUDU|nr:hypothetical protein Prudu_019456 [Prunus dulcis]